MRATRARLMAGFAVIYVIWGSTYLAIRVGIATIPPFFMGAARFLVAGVFLYAWARWRGAARPTAREWRSAAIVGFLLLCIGNGAVSWSEQRVSSGMTSLLVATVPLWLVLCEWFQGKPPGAARMVGVAIGLVGVGLLVFPASSGVSISSAADTSATINPLGALVLAVGSLSWAVGSLYARSVPQMQSPLLSIGMQMLVGSVSMFAVAVFRGELSIVASRHITVQSWLALTYLIVFGSLIGFSTYMWLIRVASPTAVGTYAYVNPLVAVLLGVVFLDEQLPSQAVLAMLVITGGVATVSLAGRTSAKER